MSIQINPNSLVDSKFLGIPYKAGSDFNGCDCMGIIALYLREHGINTDYDISKFDAYKHQWENHPRRFMDLIYQYGNMVRFSELKKFDVVFFLENGSIGNFPSYPGIMVDAGSFLTSYDKVSSYVLNLDITWRNRFWGALRLKGID